MSLIVQIKLIIFSFFFGIVFSLFISLNYKLIYNNNPIVKAISSLLCIIIATLTYFIMLEKINDGILHIYSLLVVIIGFIIESTITRKIVGIFKK